MVWKVAESWGVLGLQFILQLFLARLLAPQDYGLVGLVWVVISFTGVLVQGGLAPALLQAKSVTQSAYSSVLFASLGLALVLYLGVFVGAPFFASRFGSDELVWLLRVSGLSLFLGAFSSVQNAIVARRLLFRSAFIASSVAGVLSGGLGIWFALSGYGVWSLVIYQLANAFVGALCLSFMVRWLPSLSFSRIELRALFAFGWKILAGTLIDTAYNQARNLSVGMFYGATALGYYTRGHQLAAFAVDNVNASIRAVIFPVLAGEQDDATRLKVIARRAALSSAFVIFPLMALMAATAEPLVTLLLTDKWLAAAPFLQVFAVLYALSPVTTVYLQAINAIGRSDVTLVWEIITKIVGLGLLLATAHAGPLAIAIGALVGGCCGLGLIQLAARRFLGYGLREQAADLLPVCAMSVGVGAGAYAAQRLVDVAGFAVLLGLGGGGLLYLGFAAWFRLEVFSYLMVTMKSVVSRRRR